MTSRIRLFIIFLSHVVRLYEPPGPEHVGVVGEQARGCKVMGDHNLGPLAVVAQQLDIHPSTVSRRLKLARDRLGGGTRAEEEP